MPGIGDWKKRYIPKTKEEAIEMGRSRFFTGEECIRGHVSVRNTSNSKCAECARNSEISRGRNNLEKVYGNYI